MLTSYGLNLLKVSESFWHLQFSKYRVAAVKHTPLIHYSVVYISGTFRDLGKFIYEYLWDITKTHLYNFDPLKPHFYIVKLGFTVVYIIFLISAQNIDFGYSSQSMFWADIWKIS